MLHLQLLGGLALQSDGASATPNVHRRRLGILAVLAAAGPRGATRDRLLALFWPESDTGHARNALNQALFVLRRELAADVIIATKDDLRLNVAAIASDLAAFEDALARGDLDGAVAVYTGPFLDGVHLPDGGEFERWTEQQRARLAERYHGALEQLARNATAGNDHASAADRWRALVAADPLSARYAVEYMEALAAAGDAPAALRHARAYEALVRTELGTAPDRRLIDAVGRLSDHMGPPSAVDDLARGLVPKPGSVPPGGPEAVPADARWRASSPTRRRLRLAALLGAALVAAAGAVLAMRRRLDDHLVLVATTAGAGGEAGATAAAVAATAARQLAGLRIGARVVVRQGDARDPMALARRSGARLVALVSVDSAGAAPTLALAVWDASTGEQAWSRRTADLRASAGRVDADAGDQLATALALRADPALRNWIAAASQPARLAAYAEFRRGFDQYLDWDFEAALEHLQRAAEVDTAFTLPLTLAISTNSYLGRWAAADSLARTLDRRPLAPFDRALVDMELAFLRGDLGARYEAARRLVEAAPSSEWRLLLAVAAYDLGRAREAARILASLKPEEGWLKQSPAYWMEFGGALHLLGEHEREVAVMREGLRRFPTNRVVMQHYVMALAAAGKVSEVEAAVDRSLTVRQLRFWADFEPVGQAVVELNAHGHGEAARRIVDRTAAWYRQQPPDRQEAMADSYADILYQVGRLAEARALFEEITRKKPDDLFSESELGAIAAEQGDHATAEGIAARLAAGPPPAYGFLAGEWLANRARIAASLGDRETAVILYRDALRAGETFRSPLHWDRAFASLRGYPPADELARSAD